jgi:uncharacterized membrane protein
MADSSSNGRRVHRLYVFLVLSCIVGALTLGAIAAISEEELRLSLVLVDRDGSRHFLTPNQLFVVRAGVAAMAAALLAGMAWLVFARTRALGYLQRLTDDFEVLRKQFGMDLRLPDRNDGLTLAAILSIGVALRVYGLEHPWRFDESDSLIHFVRLDLFNLWTDYTQPNNHIFYNFLAHFCDAAFGSGASRIPAFVSGVLIMPALFFAARMLFDTRAALLATALGASLPPLIDFSTNARGYALVTLLMLASIIVAGILRRHLSLCAWAVISILMTAALFAVPTALYALGTLLLLILLSAEKQRRIPVMVESIACTAVCGFASILLYTPPALRGTWAVIVSNPFVRPTDWDVMLLRVNNYLALLWTPAEQPSALLSLGIVAVGLYFGLKTSGGRRLLIAVLLPALAICAAGRFMPPPRVWVYALPLVALAAAAGAMKTAALRRNARQAALAACVLLAVGFSFARARTPDFERRFYGQVQQIADDLEPRLDSASAIITGTPMSDPLQLRLLERDPGLEKVGFDPRDLRARRRTLEGRSKIWVVRPRPGAFLGWENGRRGFSLSQPYLSEFTNHRLEATTEHLEVWAVERP